ncbi:hypothetical protein CCMSSC00406_0009590 [Pleurotus cornucopiae]|uniref:Uncharacterized protein n=1 Tax=Pleurotus cornucopiae TaxID=5321 RepID=A0ACB7IWQ3_PLECO|nr:hypothetical protein CCMSSC00406_0009590 [Pleurotus cornucopiae]
MWPVEVVFLTILGLSSFGSCSPHERYPIRTLSPRGIVYDGNIADSYDFVIVGGGQAGLVLAARLSEDSNHTVLVLEAGDTGDAIRNDIDVPAFAYYKSKMGSSYDYGFQTVPQANLGGRAISWPRGKILGGSSAVNGMYATRPAQIEVDAWSTLVASDDSDAAKAWGWTSFLSAMKKSEHFTPPGSDVRNLADIHYEPSNHGTGGPLHISYPGYTFSQYRDWLVTLNNVGVPDSEGAGGGSTEGVYTTTSFINPTNWTRSYSKSAYIDPLPPRDNLAILANATVTRIIFDSSNSNNLTATGVEFASNRDATKRTVKVSKEVILAGGAVGSPHVLLVSGVGPKDTLEAAGVPVLHELNGVGQHMADHLSSGVTYAANFDNAGAIWAKGGDVANSPAFLSFVNSAIAYVNLTTLLGDDGAKALQDEVRQGSPSSLAGSDSDVLAGDKAIYSAVSGTIFGSHIGSAEMLLSLNTPGNVAIQAGLQHPFSVGRLSINTSNAFDTPIIDPNYLSHASDKTILREALKLARKLGQTEPLASSLGDEITPGPSVNTDAEWDAWLSTHVGTEFHPSSTCAMLPRNLGGVVNAKLQVYGTANVRVADSSIFPLSFAAHLGVPTYGVAEQAADIIRGFYNGVASPVSPPSSTSASDSSSSQTPSTTNQNNAASTHAINSWLNWTLLSATFLISVLVL